MRSALVLLRATISSRRCVVDVLAVEGEASVDSEIGTGSVESAIRGAALGVGIGAGSVEPSEPPVAQACVIMKPWKMAAERRVWRMTCAWCDVGGRNV